MDGVAPRVLYVFVPAINRDRSARMIDLIRQKAAAQAAASGGTFDVVVFPHHIRGVSWRKSRHPGWAADDLSDFITGVAGFNSDLPRATEIVLVGFSLGGLIARSAWLKDRGYDFIEGQEQGEIARNDTGWAAITSRIVLLGVPNGGFELATWSLWGIAYRVASPWADFAVEDVAAGGYWVTNLRLRWLEAFRDLPKSDLPYVAQVRGTHDKRVRDKDLGDTRYLPATHTAPMVGADHAGLVNLEKPEDERVRWPVIRHAIFGAPDPVPPVVPPKTERVAFILHGIRASNSDNWVDDMSQHMKGLGAHVVAPNTGFLSALEFFLPFTRNRKSHDFLKDYGDAAREYDPDNFVFLGHSNGTYMAARTMWKVPAVRFHRMLLAGTVVEPSFEWNTLVKRQQIGTHVAVGDRTEWQNGLVHNDRARHDWPVGVLCNLVQGLRPWNSMVGPGGVEGFVNVNEDYITKDAHVYDGGHGAALQTSSPKRRNEIAQFLTTGEVSHHKLVEPSRRFQLFGRIVSWLSKPFVIALALGIVAAFIITGLTSGWGAALIFVALPVLVIYAVLRLI